MKKLLFGSSAFWALNKLLYKVSFKKPLPLNTAVAGTGPSIALGYQLNGKKRWNSPVRIKELQMEHPSAVYEFQDFSFAIRKQRVLWERPRAKIERLNQTMAQYRLQVMVI